ncbi:MAG: P-type Cu2+ transporter [Clostridiales bacterium]|nr:P-type Cu2+ transporter [Clostridiales bacterium]
MEDKNNHVNEHTHSGHDMSGHAHVHDMDHGMQHNGHDMAQHEGHQGHDHSQHHEHMIDDFRRRFYICTLLTIPILFLSPMIQMWLNIDLRFSGDIYVLLILSSIVYLYGGYPFFIGVVDEIKTKKPGMMTLVALAITVSYVYGAAVTFGLSGELMFWELATLIDIMLLGHWIEMRSVLGASRALENLAQLLPKQAHKLMDDGSIADVSVSELVSDDKVLVKPGEKVPADAIVIDGESSVDESLLTGESRPVYKGKGDYVIGGAVNAEGSLVVQIKKTGQGSFIAQVTQLVKQAQQSRSRTQDLSDKAALWLTVIAVSAGIITFISWLPAGDIAFAIERTITVMVIACPHALGLAVPLVVAMSTSLAARRGFIVRDRLAFETARNIQAVVFDKTGTLTEGRFGVTDVVPLLDMDSDEFLKYAASAESRSEHLIAKGIIASASGIWDIGDFRAIPGKGVWSKVNGKEVMVVSPGYLDEQNIQLNNKHLTDLSEQGKTIVYVLIDGDVKGAIALADIIKPEAKNAVAQLKTMGIKCMMLTGDSSQVADWVARQIGIDEYFAEVLPEDKAAKIKQIQQRGLTTAMVGDGINDAPALATADVGIAIGAGTDVAVETADMVLVRNNPLDVVSIIVLAKATYRKMLQNLFWATAYNGLAIPLAAGILYPIGIILSPAVGAVLMSLSTIIVAINARMLKA